MSTVERYARIAHKLATERCVLLDGATGTQLLGEDGERPEVEERLWGVSAIVSAPTEVTAVHRRFVETGCDVISTNTWGLPSALHNERIELWDSTQPVHWMDVARDGVRLAREATQQAGRGDEVAVAFSLNGDVDESGGEETIRLLSRVFESDPPDLVLLETLSLVRSSTYATVEALLATGLPVWLSFRRCRHGVCGVYGEHWGGPEGDEFGRAVRRFEEMGIGALLLNCVPPDHVPGMVSWLRDFTDLPLGVYPNLGYLSVAGWRTASGVGGEEYARLALQWRAEGAQIVGGCCGVGPEHIAAAGAALVDTRPGARQPRAACDEDAEARRAAQAVPERWTDGHGRELFPLDFPDLVVEPTVYPPSQVGLMFWKYLYVEGIGAHRRCLDVGCGTGLQAIQLARNGATHVHAIDVDEAAVKNTVINAFRNDVAERVSAVAADLYPWVPEERYDVIVANIFQVPRDPFDRGATHRPLDFWGRNLVDHLMALLPEALADDGVAYIMQLSIIGQRRTAELLEAAGLRARVVDVTPVEPHALFETAREQIARIEQLSDAYHLRMGERDVLVAYLLEITRRR